MIKDFLASFDLFTEAEIKDLEALLIHRTLKKGDFFIAEGKSCKEVAFLKNGILRSFLRTESGEESTYCITFPNAFMTAYSAFITGLPTSENIQAITDSALLVLQKDDLEELAQTSHNWMKFLKIMAEQQYLELEKRLFLFQNEKAKNRYADLLLNQPDYVKQIPLQYLASYLGITSRHLSRLRKELTF